MRARDRSYERRCSRKCHRIHVGAQTVLHCDQGPPRPADRHRLASSRPQMSAKACLLPGMKQREPMLDADNVIFHLQRFEWTSPGRLELSGSWEGLGRGRHVAAPALVGRSAQGARRIEATPGTERVVRDGRWWAEFACDQELLEVSRMELDTGLGLLLELPLPTRTAPDADSSAESFETRDLERDAPAIDLYVSAVELRSELADVRAALEKAHEELTLARDDAQRERELRRSERARVSTALHTARALADQELGSLRAELADAERAAAEAESLRVALEEIQEALREQEAARATLLARLSEVRHAFSEAT